MPPYYNNQDVLFYCQTENEITRSAVSPFTRFAIVQARVRVAYLQSSICQVYTTMRTIESSTKAALLISKQYAYTYVRSTTDSTNW